MGRREITRNAFWLANLSGAREAIAYLETHGEVERTVMAKHCTVSFMQMVKTLDDLDARGILSRRFVRSRGATKWVYSPGPLFKPFRSFLQQGDALSTALDVPVVDETAAD